MSISNGPSAAQAGDRSAALTPGIDVPGVMPADGLPSAVRPPHVSTRCGDCLQPIGPDGSGHRSWCPFYGWTEFPRLGPRGAR